MSKTELGYPTIVLDSRKMHQFNVNPRFLSFHTPEKLHYGMKVVFEEQEFRIREILKFQTSRYFKKHNYYEIRI